MNTNLFRFYVYGYYGLGKIINILHKNKKSNINDVIYFPVVQNITTISDLINRICWYFPKSAHSNANIYVPVDKDLLGIDFGSLVAPNAQQNYIEKLDHIHLIKESEIDLSQADTIMLWNKKSMLEPTILQHIHKVRIVDPTYYFSVEAEIYQRLFFSTLRPESKEHFSQLSKKNYQLLLDAVKDFDKAYVFGTGPSLEKLGKSFDYSDGFRIVCNSIVKNKDLMNHIKPHLLVFGDAQHHSSPCIYADTFRQAVIEAVNETNCFVLTKDYFLPLFLTHYPELKDKSIGIEAPGVWDLSLREILFMILRNPHKIPWFTKIPGHDEEYNFPTLEKFYLRSAGSVLPSYMIPIASAVCDDVYILGADGLDPKGRSPDETFIWAYSKSCQFDEQSAFDTHPSYFRDRPQVEKFNIYGENFKELIEYGESMGKKYYSLAPSHIPALAGRFCSNYNGVKHMMEGNVHEFTD